MAWRDNLLDAALDGVPFFYEEVTSEIGRRGQVHEFVLRDDPFSEDLGKAARRWSVRAYVLGDNYALSRDLLMELIEAGGDHVFTHPYQGDFTVKIIGTVRVRESTNEGGYASFDLNFVESGLEFPLVIIPTLARIKFLSDAAVANISVRTKFNIFQAIAAAIASVVSGLQDATSLLRKLNGKIAAALGTIDNLTASIDEFLGELNTLLGAPQDLMNTLTNLVDSMLDAVATFTPDPPVPGVRNEVADTVGLTVAVLDELFAFTSIATGIPTPTPQSAAEQQNHNELNRAIRGAALASCSRVLSGLDLESSDQALSIGQNFAEKFETFLRDEGLDEITHQSFAALKAATITHFVQTARSLPSVVTYVSPATVHALVVAYELTGNPDDADDIIARNGIRHPAFVFGGLSLEVISSG